jgi:hypothetical protein
LTEAPSASLCNSGNSSAVSSTTNGVWTWQCSGQYEGTSQSCSTANKTPVPGV